MRGERPHRGQHLFGGLIMPVIKAAELAYGRLRSPDLDKQEEFLTAFGMVRADRTKNALYMRGTDAPHHIHVTELGEPKYVGIAFHAASLDDLEKLSRSEGASKVEDIDAPGWYREMLGLRCSDDVYADRKDNIVGSFNRLDRGEDYVDHHAFFCIRSDKAGLNHLSYEAADIDDIMIGHEIMKAKGYEHFWGIGRHSLGSQVFDYWGDPWGRVHEHWEIGRAHV